MRRLTLLTAAASLIFVAQAVAQTPPPPAEAAPSAQAPEAQAPEAQATSPEEAAFEAKANAFGERIKAMADEMQAAIAASGSDTVKRKTDLDAIQARYQPDADAFADQLTAFMASQAASIPAEQRDAAVQGAAAAVPQIKAVPTMVRAQVEAAAASAAKPAAPEPEPLPEPAPH